MDKARGKRANTKVKDPRKMAAAYAAAAGQPPLIICRKMPFVAVAAGACVILSAATALFADEGFDAVSIALIAQKAGVCKANVFHHFPSKDDLYLAVIKEASVAYVDYAEELYKAPCSSVDKVRKLIEFEIRNFLDNQRRTKLIMREASGDGHACVRKLARSVFQRKIAAIVRIFEQGQEQGEFRPSIDPTAAAMLLGGTINFLFTWREALREFCEVINGLDTPETYSRRIATLILSGVLPESGTAEIAGSATNHRLRKLRNRQVIDAQTDDVGC